MTRHPRKETPRNKSPEMILLPQRQDTRELKLQETRLPPNGSPDLTLKYQAPSRNKAPEYSRILPNTPE
ncbi:hypothetical protein [Absidia glauca]|uniref:Uncharacterized protein n=1 Tax=Absidia glauca TaxID=4829 RepID=A0A163J2N2_ABSGL|nr:hypothetical protein [Absidia glauca]